VDDQEDFTFLVTVEGYPSVLLREICPKDFYLAQILRQNEQNQFPIFLRLILSKEEFNELPIKPCRAILNWAMNNLLNETVFTVENWLEVGFHLCKQRWDSTMDWLESQPISKILTMIEIQKNFVDSQESEMKKASKKKK
jgi:hypothetical protein